MQEFTFTFTFKKAAQLKSNRFYRQPKLLEEMTSMCQRLDTHTQVYYISFDFL